MTRGKRTLSIVLSSMMLIITLFSNSSVNAAKIQNKIPEIKYASAPVTEYYAGDRVRFDIYAPNYGGKVEYRVILWNDSKKTYYDLWNAGNGYPNRYYTKWQPNGNTVFTLGWPIFEPGYYRITVCVKRVGIPNNKTALKGMNCDSYMESVAFLVKPRSTEVEYLLSIGDVNVTQGNVPILPQTVSAVMKDGSQKALLINWGNVDTSTPGIFTIRGNVEGTDKKAELRLVVSPGILNVYTVAAVNEACVNVVLRNEINFNPDIARFNIRGNNNNPVKIYSVFLSQDRKIIQLVTAGMEYGQWYRLNIDGKDYSFQIPSPVINRVSIEKILDIGMEAGKQEVINIYTIPDNAVLTARSTNNKAATVEIKDRKLIIKAVNTGAATITLTAGRSGYEPDSESFNVLVNKMTASPDRVNEASGFDCIFQLEVKGFGNFRRDFNINDISLGGDFKGLKVLLPDSPEAQSNKVGIRLMGNLVFKNGYGTITLSNRGWNGQYTLTSRVTINKMMQVSKPLALPEAGRVDKGTQVILYSPTSGAKIYYTLDGKTPAKNSTEFINPITINETAKIKAIAVKAGMKDSEVSTFEYTVKDEAPKPVTIREGEFRAVQGNVIGKPKEKVYIQQLVKGEWNTICSTNEETTNGQLRGFFVIDKTPFAIIDNDKAGLVIVTSKYEGVARITGYMDNDGEIQYGEYRGVQGNVIGERKERVFIQKLDHGKWEITSSTRGSGDNGILTGFFVFNKAPYAIIKYNDSGDIVVTSRHNILDKVSAKVTWD